MTDIMLGTRVLCCIAGLVLFGSAGLAFLLGDPEWFARAGSLATVFGLILMLKRNLLCIGDNSELALIEKLHFSNPMPQPDTPRYQREVERARRILRDEYLGFGITMIGTLTWGYGDLLLGLML